MPQNNITDWTKTQWGNALALHERLQLVERLSPVVADYAVFLGAFVEQPLWPPGSRVQHSYMLSPVSSPIINAMVDCQSLPLASGQVDFIVLSHLLEFCEHPLWLLEQAYRALSDRGRLVIFCFNRCSKLGFSQRCGATIDALRVAEFHSDITIQTWLAAVGFVLDRARTLVYAPSQWSATQRRWYSFYEVLGQMLCPGWGAVHMIEVRKNTMGCNPLLEVPWPSLAPS